MASAFNDNGFTILSQHPDLNRATLLGKYCTIKGTNYFNCTVVKVQFQTQHKFARSIINVDDKETYYTSDKTLINKNLLNTHNSK